MKKKGLIIATIVMVLVLAVSLTTATYAWFTTTASATISQMQIVTTASQGLQIAAVAKDGAVVKYYNGDLTLDGTTHKWAQYNDSAYADESGFGSALTLGDPSGTLIADMYGASGDGVTMFKQNDPQLSASISAANPAVAAVENVNYLALDFAITATSDGTAYINQVYVNPTATKSGMAGSMRIALFATAPGAALSDLPTWAVATNGKMLYEPYGDYTYSGAAFTHTAESNYYYTAAGTVGTSAGTKTSTGHSLQQDWTAAKVVYGTKATAPSGKTLSAAGNAAVYSDLATANAALQNTVSPTAAGVASLGTVTSGDIIYLRLVVWFDGESGACIQEFAGGGATVQINFSLEAPAQQQNP